MHPHRAKGNGVTVQTLRLPWLPKTVTNGSHGTPWAKQAERDRNKRQMAVLLKISPIQPIDAPVVIECVWTFRVRRTRDADGLIARLKSVVDALVLCGVLPNGDALEWVQWGRQSVVIGRDEGVELRLIEQSREAAVA